jgi:hypothetical protein
MNDDEGIANCEDVLLTTVVASRRALNHPSFSEQEAEDDLGLFLQS